MNEFGLGLMGRLGSFICFFCSLPHLFRFFVRMTRDLVYLGVGPRVPGVLYSEIALVEASSQLIVISAFIYMSGRPQ